MQPVASIIHPSIIFAETGADNHSFCAEWRGDSHILEKQWLGTYTSLRAYLNPMESRYLMYHMQALKLSSGRTLIFLANVCSLLNKFLEMSFAVIKAVLIPRRTTASCRSWLYDMCIIKKALNVFITSAERKVEAEEKYIPAFASRRNWAACNLRSTSTKRPV